MRPKSENLDNYVTPEQNIEGLGMADLYFLPIPRQTLEEINKEANGRGLTFAQALSEALSDWFKKGKNTNG